MVYAQTKEYNELSSKTLLSKLKIHHVPAFLFQAKTFVQYKHELVCAYKTKEPQSYFTNSRFLFMNTSAKDKVVYLKALSMRRLSNKNTYIPYKYFPNVKYNPFLDIKDGLIHFPLESSKER